MFEWVTKPFFSICQLDFSFSSPVSLSFCIKSILLYYQRLRIKHYQIQTCPYMTIIITKDKDCDSRKIMQPFLWGISESWRISTSQSLHFVGFSVVNPANQRAFVLFSRDSWLSNSRQEDHESGFKCLRNPAEEKTASVFSLNNGWENKSFFFFLVAAGEKSSQTDRQANSRSDLCALIN